MLNINKYERNQDQLTYSEEGFGGGLKGYFLGTFAGGFYTGRAEENLQKIRAEIDATAEKIAKLRNGEIAEAKAKGIEVPSNVKPVDAAAVKKSFWLGFLFGPIIGASKGSQIQDESEKLAKLVKELEEELKKADAEKAKQK